MIQYIVSVQDRASQTFARPFVVPHRNIAIRDFTDEVNRADPQNPLNKHPDDYDLSFLGEFDDSTGNIVCGDAFVLVRGKDALTVS